MPEQSFGRFVRERRRALDLTQEELARRVGCAAITIRKVEADDFRPSVQIAERLAMALGIPLDERAEFVRRARAVRAEPVPVPTATPTPTPEEIGREDLSGRAIRGYALGERIGTGGMGAVYRAMQPLVEREVAIKIILPAYANHPDFIRRFESEAQLIARLEHPHIVPLYDYWREPGVAYLVMRLLRGGSLQTQLQNGPLPLDAILHVLDQIGFALHAAHRVGVIHRDLKPANIMLDEDGNAYLADFGIAKNLGNPNLEEQTQLDMIVGSPHYMSPEQIRSLSVRPQTDIYCLGIVMYELLTGALPFTGPTPFDLIQQHVNAPLPTLAAHRSGLPAALDAVIGRATAKDPDDRYPDVPGLLADFRRALDGSAVMRPGLISVPEEEAASEPINPFKGLRAFGEADAEDFYGREALIQQLLARLSEGGDLSRFLAVVGPSGSGKSSVVKAGLVPVLRRGGLPDSDNWFIVDFLPGPHPFEELEAALLRVAVNPPVGALHVTPLLSQLKEDERGLLRAVRRCLPDDPNVELVLVIDQFEEVFTLVADEAERALLLSSLVTAVMDERSRVHVILTLRADFIDRPLRYMDFGELLQRRSEFVLPLTPDELERAIVGPTRRVGLKLESGLTSAIMRDVGDQPGALPLLQYALTELFDKRAGNTITKGAYQSIGGVMGALGRRAEDVFGQLDEAGQSVARQLFLRLVTLGEGVDDTRRRVLRSELESLATDRQPLITVLESFGKHRLLSFDRDPVTRGPTVEVAHEALLREWPRLREWLTESRADVRQQRQLAAAAADWQQAQHDVSFLLSGARLEQFAGWALTTRVALTTDERAFLDVSIAERDRSVAEERERQRRELDDAKRIAETVRKLAETEKQRAEEQTQSANRLRLRNRLITAAGAVALVLAVLAGVFAFQSENARRLATARELASAAVANLNVDPERSILLALQAVTETYTINQTALPEAEEALHRAVQASRVESTLRGHTDIVWQAVFSPAERGTRLATASADGTAKVWDVATGQVLFTLVGHEYGVTSVAFSPDRKLLATGSDDQTARIWDAVTGKELWTLRGHSSNVFRVAFDPSGTRLATASFDGTAKVWEVATGHDLLTLVGHTDVVEQAIFSPDGTRLATASDDGTAKVWDADTGQELFTLAGHKGWVLGVAFSPDGTRLATASVDRTAKVWSLAPSSTGDIATGQVLFTLYGHADVLTHITFSIPDGTRLATASFDRQAKVWDSTTGQELFSLAGHTDQVTSVAFSPDGSQIVTASEDGTAKIWNAAPSGELLTLVNGPASASEAPAWLAYSPDGTRLAASNANPTPKVWDLTTGQVLFNLAGHTGVVRGIAYSSDAGSARIATASDDGTAKVWDASTGQALLTLSGHTDQVMGVAFSRDGTRVATGSADGTAKVWDAVTGQEVLTLSGHPLGVFNVAFSPAERGTHLATAGFDGTAKVWDATTGRELLTLSGHTDGVRLVVFSPDGARLATASFDGTAKVWDAATGRELLTLSGHAGTVFGVAFSPDGTRLATASADRTAKLWDAVTGQELLTLYGHTVGVTNLAFSPDGLQLATASYDGTDRIYLLRLESVIALARSRLTRTWWLEECQQYLHIEQCPQP